MTYLPCEDDDCAYYKTDDFGERQYCSKLKCYIDELITQCNFFKLPETCEFCVYLYRIVYETGTIDDIAYHCKLQDNKLIYDDINPYIINYADFPECNIGKFERRK